LLGVDLWCKRDDLSGLKLGGNKVRKLEFLLADAKEKDCRTILTVGGIGSNHVLTTTYYAQAQGFMIKAVVFPQPLLSTTRAHLELIQALDAELLPCANRLCVPFALWSTLHSSEKPYLIGPGGSSPLGTLGYVCAALELGEQINEGQIPQPDDIFITLGSGGSLAGLALGCHLAGIRSRIIGVRVVEWPLINAFWVKRLIRRTGSFLYHHGAGRIPVKTNFTIFHDAFGGRYGKVTPEAIAARDLVQNTEGLLLETTYTAKTMASLINYCHGPGHDRRILFWNTFNSRDTTSLFLPPVSNNPGSLPPAILRWLGE
jgi:D-cysteine desulfhydrase